MFLGENLIFGFCIIGMKNLILSIALWLSYRMDRLKKKRKSVWEL